MAAAIDLAVRQQLASDGRDAPSTYQEVMGTDYKYTSTTMRPFLNNVSLRLKTDTPSYRFDWANLNADTCVADSVGLLEAYISTETTVAA